MKKNTLPIVILICLAIVLVVWYASNKKSATNQPVPVDKQDATTFTDVPENELPKNMPATVPIEAGAKVTQGFNAQNQDAKTIGVKEFVSAKSPGENYVLYQQYLEQNGYTLVDQIDEPDQKIISGDKDGFRLRIRIYSENNETRVTLNSVQL